MKKKDTWCLPLASTHLWLYLYKYMHIHSTYTKHTYSYRKENIIKIKMPFYCVRKQRDIPPQNEVISTLVLDKSGSRKKKNLFLWLEKWLLTHGMEDPVYKKKSKCTETMKTSQTSICKQILEIIFCCCINGVHINLYSSMQMHVLTHFYGLLFGESLRYRNKFEYWYSVKHKILGKWGKWEGKILGKW